MAEVPPVYVEFKGDTTNLNASIGQAKKSLTGFAAATSEASIQAKKLGVAQIALGGIIANVATAAAANVKQFAMSFVGEYQHIAGEVRTLSKVMDGTPEQLSVISFAAKRFGVDSAELSMGIRTLSKHLVANDDAAKNLGIKYRNANGALLPTIDIINNLADRYKALPSKIEQNAFAMEAFGRAGKNMAPLLALGSEGIKELGLSAEELGMVMSGKDLKAVKDYGFAQKDLKEAIDGVKVTIGRDLLPILASSASALNDTLLPALKEIVAAFTNSGFSGGVRQAQDSLQGFILGLDGVKSAIYQVIVMVAAFKTAMIVFTTAPAVFLAIKSAILAVRSVMASLYVATLLGSAGFKAFFLSIKTGLISTGLGALLVLLGLIIAALINAYATSETFRNKVNAVFMSVAKAAVIVANAVIKIYNAFAKLIGLKGISLISLGGGGAGGREDIASAYGLTTSGQLTPDYGGGGGYTGATATGKTKPAKKTAFELFQEKQQAALQTMQAKLQLGMARTDDLKKENDLQQTFKNQVKAMYDAAVAQEKKTRKTKEHAAAQSYLNEMMTTYAGAIESANAASQRLADSQREAAEAQKKAADEAAEAAKKAAERFEQANREFLKFNTLSKSQGWLAALTRNAGPTQANFGGFIEVPVVIDGQTVFRATQKYSLINNRRNVSNGLATSGSLI